MAAALKHKFVVRAALLASAASGITPALAQTPAAPEATTADIVVTAQFRGQKLQDTPLSITAVNAASLEARSQTDIAQVARQAPNVTLVPGGAVFGPSLGAQIRGVGQFDFNPAYEPGVGLYVDDVYFATLTGGVFDLLDLDRVEILRGPQGTLTGRNSEGGAVKLFSKQPTGDGGGFLEGTYGSRNRIGLRGSADFKLAEGLYGRVAGVYKNQDGYISQIDYGCAKPGNPEGVVSYATSGNCTVAKLGQVNYQAIRGQLRYNPSDNFDWTIAADYSNEDRLNSAEATTFSKNPNYICGLYCTYFDYRTTGANGTQSKSRNTFQGGGVSSKMTIGLSDDFSVTSITAYREYVSTFGTDDDGGPAPVLSSLGDNRLRHHFFSEELRLNGKIGSAAEFTVGGYYSDQKTVYYTRQDIRYVIPGVPFQFIGNDPVNASSKAVFGTVIVRPADGFTLTGGLRYTEEKKDYTFLRRNYDGTPVTGLAAAFGLGALDGLKSKYSGSKVDYRLSADYRFSPAVLAYATVSTGFKGGGVTARPFTARQALEGTFKPETLRNFEIGLKTDLLDRTLRFNLSAFINDYKDVQLPLSDCSAYGGGPCGVVANAGDASFKGVELEIQARPIPGFDFDGSLSYLTSKWKRLSAAVGTGTLFTDPATSAPEWKWSVGAQYRAELGTSGSLTPRVDVSYDGKRWSGRSLGFGYSLPSYALANARLTWRNPGDDLSISAEVTNVFDRYYNTSIFSAVYAFSGVAYSQVGRPREWAVSIKKKF
jgi:iron complex outermembrane recepter protein